MIIYPAFLHLSFRSFINTLLVALATSNSSTNIDIILFNYSKTYVEVQGKF